MLEDKLEFYHSKGKLFLAFIFSLLFVPLGALILYVAYIDESIFMMALALFICILFSIFAVTSILKIIRDNPYIIITEEYIQLDPYTKSEATIYYEDIKHMTVSEFSFQKMVEIILYDEDARFAQLSLHNKIRLCMNRVFGFTLFTINPKAIRKFERPELLEILHLVVQEKIKKQSSTPIIETAQKQDTQTDFMEEYDPTPTVDRSIDRSYFLKSYGYSLFMFVLSFILFYLLISRSGVYLFYIVISFILYPFAKVLFDWLFGFKVRHALDKQKGITYYFDQLMFLFDYIVFHVSLFIAPIGMLFLLIRFIVNRVKN